MNREKLKQSLLEILERSTGEKFSQLEENQNLRESLNLDSIDLVSTAIEIQTNFSINLTGEDLNGVVQVKDLLDLMELKLAQNSIAA